MMGEARSNLASAMRELANKVVMRVTRLPTELRCQLDAAVAVSEKGVAMPKMNISSYNQCPTAGERGQK